MKTVLALDLSDINDPLLRRWIIYPISGMEVKVRQGRATGYAK